MPVVYLGLFLERAGGVDRFLEETWKKVAFVCRYGKQPMDIALQTDTNDLNHFMRQLAVLIEGENRNNQDG